MAADSKMGALDFVPGMISHMRDMCQDHNERKAATSRSDISVTTVLGKGIWYPIDYCKALQKFGQNERLNWIIRTGAAFHGMMPQKIFVPIDDPSLPTGRKLSQYKIAKEVLPSAALDAIQRSACILGCSEVRDIAAYRALRDLFGDEKFNILFAWDSATPLQIGGNENPYKRFFKNIELQTADSLQPGDFCHFSNIRTYIHKHPFGPGRGFNAICIESRSSKGPKFLAMGVKTEGVSIGEMETVLLEEYNAPSDRAEPFFNREIVSHVFGKTLLQNEEKSREYVNSFKKSVLTPEEFKTIPNRDVFKGDKTEGRLLLSIMRPDIVKIQEVVQAPLASVRRHFNNLRD